MDVYVVKCSGDLPVYTVKPESKDGPLRVLHRDLLMPIRLLPLDSQPPDTPKLPQ